MARFAHVGTDKDGQPILRPYSPAEEAARDADEAAHLASLSVPAPRTEKERLEDLERKVAELETKPLTPQL